MLWGRLRVALGTDWGIWQFAVECHIAPIKNQNFFFRPRKGQSNYVYVTRPKNQNQRKCNSMVGMIGGKQYFWLSSHCSSVDIKHEVGHVLGLFHTHNRPDRNKYIEVIKDNIKPASRESPNFKICKHCWTFDTPYDFESIMHYPHRASSHRGHSTLKPKVSWTIVLLRSENFKWICSIFFSDSRCVSNWFGKKKRFWTFWRTHDRGNVPLWKEM